MGTDDTIQAALTPRVAAAEAIIRAAPADMSEVVEAVARGDVEGARVAAEAFGHSLGTRVRATLLSNGAADG